MNNTLRQMEQDAARYRWLRDVARTVDYSAWLDVARNSYRTGCRHSGSHMDADIDAMLAKQPHSQGSGQ